MRANDPVSWLRATVGWILHPIRRVMLHAVHVSDPWRPVRSWFVGPRALGSGSIHYFRWYLAGESKVEIRSVAELCAWLAQCTYHSDWELFNERDFWQHPSTFENLRKGDCEDHALWAWRKLIELGFDARLFVGQWLTRDDGRDSLHAWVVFRDNGEERVLEPVCKDANAAVRPLAQVRQDYVPHYSVNRAGRITSHAGLLLWNQWRHGMRPRGQTG